MTTTLLPRTPLSSFRKEIDQLFERFWTPEEADLTLSAEWTPRMDIVETKDAMILKAEVPGIDPKDIHVSFQDQVLTIRGEKKDEKKEKDDRYFRLERMNGMFARSFHLPVPIEAGRVNAAFKYGLLTVTLPKGIEAKAAEIQIRET
jgi:HSP20 family protein